VVSTQSKQGTIDGFFFFFFFFVLIHQQENSSKELNLAAVYIY
jgi:hypothetical protein